MAFQAFLIALIIFVGKADYFVGTAMLGRPLVLGMLVGIALGDVSQGVIIGFQLELVFMGMQAIGASIPPDMIVGSVLGTAFAIGTGNGIDTAVTIAMPAAILSAFVVNLFYGVITPLMARTADKFAAEDNDKGISAVFLANGFLFDATWCHRFCGVHVWRRRGIRLCRFDSGVAYRWHHNRDRHSPRARLCPACDYDCL